MLLVLDGRLIRSNVQVNMNYRLIVNDEALGKE